MANEGFTIFSLKISCAQFDVYRVRGVSLIKFTYFDSCLVLFDFDILSLIKKKTFFLFDFYLFLFIFDFQNLSRLISQWRRFWFSKWDRYGSYQCDSFSSGSSAILKARTLRHISWPNETERVSPLRLLSHGKSFYSNGGLKDIVLQSKVLLGPSLISRKTSYLRGAF